LETRHAIWVEKGDFDELMLPRPIFDLLSRFDLNDLDETFSVFYKPSEKPIPAILIAIDI
jgi:hypothetical protein